MKKPTKRRVVYETDDTLVVLADPRVPGTYPYIEHEEYNDGDPAKGGFRFCVALDGDHISFLGMFCSLHPDELRKVLRRPDRGFCDEDIVWRPSAEGVQDWGWRPIPPGLGSYPWWVHWRGICDCCDVRLGDLRKMLTARHLRSLENRGRLVELVASYHGWVELDNYPERLEAKNGEEA